MIAAFLIGMWLGGCFGALAVILAQANDWRIK